jgi:hypothetical protein
VINAVAAGVDARVKVLQELLRVSPASPGQITAADGALDPSGLFWTSALPLRGKYGRALIGSAENRR